jgi:hypothetical protein
MYLLGHRDQFASARAVALTPIDVSVDAGLILGAGARFSALVSAKQPAAAATG